MKTHARKANREISAWLFEKRAPRKQSRPVLALAGLLAMVVPSIGLSSCAGYTTNAAGTTNSQAGSGSGVLVANTSTVDFGNVEVGSSSTQTLTLTDTGTGPVAISGVSASGAGFSVVGGSLSGTLAAGQSLSVPLQFAPQSAGNISGDLTVTSDASNTTAATSSLVTSQTAHTSYFKIGLHGNATEPLVSLSPPAVVFTNVAVGQTSAQTVTLTNTGNANLHLKGATVSGAGFSIQGLAVPEMIPAGQGVSFSVQFAPVSTAGVTGSVTLTDNAPGTPQTLALTGNQAASLGILSANPASVNFGSVLVGSSGSASITLTNSGSSPVSVSAVTASGSGFSIGGFSAGTLNPAASRAFTVTFSPTAAGNASGSLSVASNASDSTLPIALSGSGTASQPQLSISPSSVAFQGVHVGTSASQTVTLKNTGNATLNVGTAAISGSGYTMTLAPTSINAGTSATFSVTFTPTAEGSDAGSISISSNAPGSPAAVALSGSGLEALGSASPASVSFGSVTVGNSNSQVVTLKNAGNTTLTFSQMSVSGAGFSVSGLSTSSTVAAGGTLNFNAVFTPTSASSSTGSIALVTNGSPAQITVALTGSGTAAAQVLSVSSSTLTFGNVQVGSSNSQTARVTNTGNSDVTISGVTVTGNGYSASGITSGLILSANQSATLTVDFAPSGLGNASGSITIASNATNGPSTISLSGESHTVLLSWAASTSTGVTGYYVYRGTQSGQYTKINATALDASTEFTDSTVQAATTYYYVVTAVDASGAESTYSNPTTVSVP